MTRVRRHSMLQDHTLQPDDPGNRLRGTRAGARGGFDIWYEPMSNAMLTASASLSTVGSSFWTRAAAGWRAFDIVWLGPDFDACGDDSYRQLRFGAHVTSLRMWGYEFSAGAGVGDGQRPAQRNLRTAHSPLYSDVPRTTLCMKRWPAPAHRRIPDRSSQKATCAIFAP